MGGGTYVMAKIVLNGKSVITQSSTDTPVLGPDILFPNGHVIQIVDAPTTAILSRSTANSLGAFSTPFNVTISNCSSTSKILISCYVTHSCDADNITMFALYDNTNSQYVSGNNSDGHFANSVDGTGRVRSSSFQVLYDPPSFSSGSLQIELYMKGSGGSGTHNLNYRSQQDGYGRGTSNIILQEIAG